MLFDKAVLKKGLIMRIFSSLPVRSNPQTNYNQKLNYSQKPQIVGLKALQKDQVSMLNSKE